MYYVRDYINKEVVLAAKRKRAPGAGRPRMDASARRMSVTMRINQNVLSAIDRQAEQNGRSRSREIELQLEASFLDRVRTDWRADHHYGLGRMVARLAWAIEEACGVAEPLRPSNGRTWMDDPFTAAAVRAAIDIAIRGLMPSGEIEVPAKVKAKDEWDRQVLPPERAAFYQTAEGQGEIAAMSLLEQMRDYSRPPLDRPPNTYYADIFYELPMIREMLGLELEPASGLLRRRQP